MQVLRILQQRMYLNCVCIHSHWMPENYEYGIDYSGAQLEVPHSDEISQMTSK